MPQPWSKVELRTVEGSGVKLCAAVRGEGPLVLFVHGWPESAYSWRHQLGPVAEAGFRAAALDVRGYGGSEKPEAVEAYSMRHMVADLLAAMESFGEREAVLVGHDWGAPIVWTTAALHPERVRGVAGLSVPHLPPAPLPPTQLYRRIHGDRFFYQLYFQEPGVAEAELEADVRGALRRIFYALSGDAPDGAWPTEKPKDAKLLDGLPEPERLPPWLHEADLDYYAKQFEAGGFRGPLNRYRNIDRDWEELPELAERTIEVPACFIAGTREPVMRFVPGVDLVERMRPLVPGLRSVQRPEDAGHWVQQECPETVNDALLAFLRGLA